jgi:predicted amidophosphoribosyltransferase
MPATSCRCCQEDIPMERPRICPECGHVFKGNGWDGIDAHWRAKHERVMPYEAFWESLCQEHRR